MKTTKMDKASLFRKPTIQETEIIVKYIRRYNASKIKICKFLSVVFTVIGLTLMGSIGIDIGETTIVTVFLGLICFLLVFLLTKYKNKCSNETDGFVAGEFLFMNGTVSKIETNIDTPGCINVFFTSTGCDEFDGWYRIRQENVEVGSKLLLLVPNSDRTNGFSPHVFSEFMFTDEGSNLIF